MSWNGWGIWGSRAGSTWQVLGRRREEEPVPGRSHSQAQRPQAASRWAKALQERPQEVTAGYFAIQSSPKWQDFHRPDKCLMWTHFPQKQILSASHSMEGSMGGSLVLLLLALIALVTPLMAQGDSHPLKILFNSHFKQRLEWSSHTFTNL